MSGREAAIVAQHFCELQRVHHRLAAGVIVGEDKGGRGVLLDVLDALLPLLQFLGRVEVVMRGSGPGWPAEFALPMLRIAPVQPHISDARSEQ